MPIDKDKIDSTVTETISAGHALSLASGALSDLSGFCVRNPDVCVQGHEAFVAFSAKAKYVSGIAYTYINAQLSEKENSEADNALSIAVPTPKHS